MCSYLYTAIVHDYVAIDVHGNHKSWVYPLKLIEKLFIIKLKMYKFVIASYSVMYVAS